MSDEFDLLVRISILVMAVLMFGAGLTLGWIIWGAS